MYRIIKSERIKLQHTIEQTLLWLAPILLTTICLILNPIYLYSMALNWWYTIFIYILMALTCSLVHQKEEKKLKYQNIFQSPIPLSKLWRGKIYNIGIDTFVSANILGIIICILSYFFQRKVENGFLITLLAVNCVCLVNIWLIPIYLFLANKTGFYIPLIIGAIASVVGVLCSTKYNWWFVPVSWAPHIMCTVVKYMPNGLPLDDKHLYLLVAWPTILEVIFCSLTLFIILTFVTSIIFERGHKKC